MLNFPPSAWKIERGKLILTIHFFSVSPSICWLHPLLLWARAWWEIPNWTKVLLGIILLKNGTEADKQCCWHTTRPMLLASCWRLSRMRKNQEVAVSQQFEHLCLQVPRLAGFHHLLHKPGENLPQIVLHVLMLKNTQVSRDQDVYFCEAESPSIFKPLYQVPHSIGLVLLGVVDNPSFPAGHAFIWTW